MGQQDSQKALFSYHIDLDRRIRADHPLRRVAAVIEPLPVSVWPTPMEPTATFR